MRQNCAEMCNLPSSVTVDKSDSCFARPVRGSLCFTRLFSLQCFVNITETLFLFSTLFHMHALVVDLNAQLTFRELFCFDLLPAAQTVVSWATRSCGLSFQPQREGIFWALLRRWQVSTFMGVWGGLNSDESVCVFLHPSVVFLIKIVDSGPVVFAEAVVKEGKKLFQYIKTWLIFVFLPSGQHNWLQLDRKVLDHDFYKTSGPLELRFLVR